MSSARCTKKAVCKKLFLVKRKLAPSFCTLLSASAEQLAPLVTHDEIIMMRTSSGARRLYAISIRPVSTATGAVLVFKDSLSFSTEQSLHRQLLARGSTTTGRDVSHGSTAKTANLRFTVLRPWSKLSTLSMRTLGYSLGRSGIARRAVPGFLAAETL